MRGMVICKVYRYKVLFNNKFLLATTCLHNLFEMQKYLDRNPLSLIGWPDGTDFYGRFFFQIQRRLSWKSCMELNFQSWLNVCWLLAGLMLWFTCFIIFPNRILMQLSQTISRCEREAKCI